jgi:uncharacterized protein
VVIQDAGIGLAGGAVRPALAARLEVAAELLGACRRVLVAYSGGVDSSLVLELGRRVLGDACTGFIAISPSLPGAEREAALALAAGRGFAVEEHPTHELERAAYLANGADRCYHCKTEVYGLLARLAAERAAVPADGFNRDDRADWRPGRRAAREAGVISPLDAAGMGKAEVREAARALGLPNWDKPAAACLASRIPQGTPVTLAALARVEAAEALVRAEGFRQVRVRELTPPGGTKDGGVASVEVEPELVGRLRQPRRLGRVAGALRPLGYADVRIDPEGYRAPGAGRISGAAP